MELVNFQWHRCVDGYRVVRAGIETASHLFEHYRPLEISGLFVEFAKDTTANASGMLKFCEKFGLPIGEGPAQIADGGVVTRRHESVALDTLLAHQAVMRQAFNLFEKDDPSELIKHCNWQEGLTSLRIQLQRNPDGRLAMLLVPPDLLRAMWLQFAQHACSGTRILRCEQCNRPFVVGTGTNRRRTSQYCSRACGKAAWQAKH